jgi:RTX calcium-binding nonapeptide repeat (4 copies)
MSNWPRWASQMLPTARAKRHVRRRVSSPARQRLAFESLENRRLLTVSSNFLAGALMISLSSNDDIALSTAGGNVKLAFDGMTGLDPDSGALFAGNVQSIVITGIGNFANTIDLTGVNKSDFSSLVNIALDGGGGSDTYKLDQSILPAAAVVSVTDSGASPGDTDVLSLTSTNAGPETIGISQTSVTRSTGPTVTYSGMESLQVAGTSAADTINISNTGATTFTSVNAGGGLDAFGAIDLTQIGAAGLIINAGSNGESLTLGTSAASNITISSNLVQRSGNGPVAFSGISSLKVNGSASADTFQVNSTAPGTTTLDGQGGGDIYNVIQSALGAPINLNDSGASGTDQITSTSNSGGGELIGITNAQITRSGSQTISYSGIENLSVSGTAGSDTFTVTTTPSGPTTLDGQGSGDNYNITQSGLGGTLSISDTGASGADQLTSTSLAVGGEMIGITNSQITRSGSQTISYGGIENLNVNGTNNPDVFAITTTPNGTTTLDGLDGGDTYNVTQSALGGPLMVSDSGPTGVDQINSTSTASGESIGIVPNQITRGGAATISYSGVENLNVSGTAGVDTFTVTSTPPGTTTLDGLNGADTYNITQSGLGGPLSVNDSGLTGVDQLTSTTNLVGGEMIGITNSAITRSGEQTVSYSGIENLTVNGTLGVDTFNVTTTPSGTTTLDGLASGDTYNITQSALGGALAISDSGGSGTDLLSSTSLAAGGESIGITSSQVTRSGSQTISYTGIENLNVTGTTGGDTFTVTTTPTGSTMLDGQGSDDTYNITQSALGGPLTINDTGGTGGDQLTSSSSTVGEVIGITSSQITRSSSQTITYSGIENLTVNGTAGSDTFNVTTTPSGLTTLDGQEGGDTYNITQSALGGLLSINDSGASGTDTLNSISLAAGGESIGVTNSQITRSGSQTIGYTGIENLSVTGTVGADTFTVTTTPTGSTMLDGQNSGDTYNITQSALGGPLTVSDTGSSGTDQLTRTTTSAVGETIGVSSTQITRTGSMPITYSGLESLTVVGTPLADNINVSSTAAATATTINADPLPTDLGTDVFGPIDLTTIGAAGLFINAGGDGEALVLNTTAAGTVAISNSVVQRNGNGQITYQGISTLTVNGTSGVDVFNIASTSAAVSTTVNAGAGNDVVTLGNAGSLAGFLGVLTIHGEANDATPTMSLTSGSTTNTLPVGDTLHFDDSASAAGQHYTLNPGTFMRTGLATVTFDGAETIVLDAGTSADTIDISNTLPQVNVTVNGNAGADTINLANNGNGSNVTLNGGADGDTLNILAVATGSVVLANGGAGNDTVNVSTDAPANTGTLDAIVGTLGIDTGGDSDKIILSDQGQTATANTNVVVRSDRVDGFAGPTNAVSIRYAFSGSLTMTLIGSQTLADKFHVALSAYPFPPPPNPLTLKFDGLGQPVGGMDGLRIDGTTGKDNIKVGTFGSADAVQIQNIECLQLFGSTGDDTLQNDTAVPSLIDGGDGNDTLVGGSAVDVIFGGDGTDTIYGRGGGDYLFADHEFNNRSPQVKHSVNGDTVYGDKGLTAGDPFSSNPGVDTIVLVGTDNVDAGGQVGDTIIGNVNSLSVLDWLKARFLTSSGKNVQDAINKALAQPCTMIF